MAVIDRPLLSSVAERAAGLMLNESAIEQLRRDWPGIHFTLCSEDDVPARLDPAHTGKGFNLYLVSNASHCVGFTNQFEAASGIVLATLEPD